MPWRLIGILLLLTFFMIFAGFNVHRVTIFLGPLELKDMPLFVVIMFSFIAGAVTAIPFSVIKSLKRAKKQKKDKNTDTITAPANVLSGNGHDEEMFVPDKKKQRNRKNKI